MTLKLKRTWLKTPCQHKKCRGQMWSHRGPDDESMKETQKWGLAKVGRDVNDLHLRWNHPKSEGVSKESLGDLKRGLTRTWSPKPDPVPIEPQKLIKDN